jgi:hypothetical protein
MKFLWHDTSLWGRSMNKEKGIGGGILAVILAGLFFRGTVTSSPSAPETSGTESQGAASKPVTAPKNEGPWIASCAYWSSSKQSAGQVVTDTDTPCGSDKAAWGIPGPDEGHAPEIRAIIATVPDPIHSHLAMDFDRTVDTLLLAASGNGYHLGSYYWLPWRRRANASSKSESGKSAAESAEQEERDKIRELQPGLIILRYAPDAKEWEKDREGFSRNAYHRVIYLFLVAETPVLGVNGFQLQNAFRYKQMLHDRIPASDTSAVSRADRLSIIGPVYSGSAASLHEGIESALLNPKPKPAEIEIAGVTGTPVAAHELDPENSGIYHSFGENVSYEQDNFIESLFLSGYDLGRVAVLSEAGTVFGRASGVSDKGAKTDESQKDAAKEDTDLKKELEKAKKTILSLRFPRELSLLRNAQTSQTGTTDSSAPTPYLNLSLKDYATSDDTEPRFSETQSPLSIEAQLMAIAHQLQRSRIQFIVISASNILDDIFLAQFLHRACPDARIVTISGGDLLFERDADNAPYVGSISISPYLLTSLSGERAEDSYRERANQWLYSDGQSAAIYNAASYIFWDRTTDSEDRPVQLPQFTGYISYSDTSPADGDRPQVLRMPLWATTVGADGYYPLAVLNWCPSDFTPIIPMIQLNPPKGSVDDPFCIEKDSRATVSVKEIPPPIVTHPPDSIDRGSGINPSLLWGIIAAILILVCLGHSILLFSAQYWSPFTRDLAIDENDQPRRRTVYLCIGTAVLVLMAFVTAFPLLRVSAVCNTTLTSRLLAWGLLAGALLALVSTVIKTRRYFIHPECLEYAFFNWLALLALLFTIGAWILICLSDESSLHGSDTGSMPTRIHNFAGLYFSYRCLQPLSGVCPLVPILLLLLAWYLWAVCQTSRLRFSEMHRPRLPLFVPPSEPPSLAKTPYPLFVPDETLGRCKRPTDPCLYRNITTLLITREVIRRFCVSFEKHSAELFRRSARWLNGRLTLVLGIAYAVLFVAFDMAAQIRSVDHFVFPSILATLGFPTLKGHTLYEFLIVCLFFPLVMVTLSGWLRTILIWGALSRGVLEPLERVPLRCAFSRVKGGSWMNMLRQSGLHIRWRDMSRSSEAIRQIVNHPDVKGNSKLAPLAAKHRELNWYVGLLVRRFGSPGADPVHLPQQQLPRPAESSDDPRKDASDDPRKDASDDPCKDAVYFPLLLPRSPEGIDDSCSDRLCDLGPYPNVFDLCLIRSVEVCYAEFCQLLLRDVLIPYWDDERVAFVEDCSCPGDDKAEKSAADEKAALAADDEKAAHEGDEKKCKRPTLIALAEELLVVRYIALIRAVLVNVRYLMVFVAAVFVLSLVAWNSYPFQPHAFIDWCFTILLGITSTGFIVVFAQMHRNAILSRITDSKPNELGWDFYLRLITFGGIPVLTWLAYQFPQIGGSLYKILQPGLQVVK